MSLRKRQVELEFVEKEKLVGVREFAKKRRKTQTLTRFGKHFVRPLIPVIEHIVHVLDGFFVQVDEFWKRSRGLRKGSGETESTPGAREESASARIFLRFQFSSFIVLIIGPRCISISTRGWYPATTTTVAIVCSTRCGGHASTGVVMAEDEQRCYFYRGFLGIFFSSFRLTLYIYTSNMVADREIGASMHEKVSRVSSGRNERLADLSSPRSHP